MRDEILDLISKIQEEVKVLKRALKEAANELNVNPEDFINKARGQ